MFLAGYGGMVSLAQMSAAGLAGYMVAIFGHNSAGLGLDWPWWVVVPVAILFGKRGLSAELVIAPYATALASLVTPTFAAENFKRLAALGGEGRFGFYEALDYNPRGREVDTPPQAIARPAVVQAYFAHHQGMSLVALANVICGDAFVLRFHADPRVQATELLLQERVPREAILLRSPARPRIRRCRRRFLVFAARRFRTPHSTSAHTHFPFERALHRGGHERWRRLQYRGATSRSLAGATTPRLTPAPITSTCAIPGPIVSGPPPTSLAVRSRIGSRRPSISTRSRSAAAILTSRLSSRSPYRLRMTWRCGA